MSTQIEVGPIVPSHQQGSLLSNLSTPGTSSASAHSAVTLAETSRALFDERTVVDTLQRIVDLSLTTVRGCDGASVSLVQGDAVITPVWTDDKVVEVDSMQYSSGEGPCLSAIAHEATFHCPDLSSDPRWPVFGPLAAERGMHSLLSLRLGADRTLGSLNLYANSRAAYDEPDRLGALAFSIHAGIAWAAAGARDSTRRALADESSRLGRLEGALPSRQTIALAQGMLMAHKAIDEHEAFTLLRSVSLRMNLKVIDVALRVVATGELPAGPVGAR